MSSSFDRVRLFLAFALFAAPACGASAPSPGGQDARLDAALGDAPATPADVGASVGADALGDAEAASADSASVDAASADGGVADAAAAVDGGTPCVPFPTPDAGPVSIGASAHFCSGVISLGAGAHGAAVEIVASHVTIECDGTLIQSTAGRGTTAMPTIGFLADGVEDVTLRGCGAKGFRFGLLGRSANRLRVERARLDDNFSDPSLGWVQDSEQGGGIRFESVTGSTVASSSFARNWNGIELRQSTGNLIADNQADHCSNSGATLVGAVGNVLRHNDMSWAIRGDNLSYPGHWYGVDTKDSAGILVDADSRSNTIESNDFRYGGDGIFIRSVTGRCATDNLVQGNDASFSPHNAIECWCNRNRFIGNTASDSDYGLWLGGMSGGVVRGNRVERNRTDGMSIQIGEDRHALIEGNFVHGNGRTGILLTGREIQSWQPLTNVGPNLANSSQIIVQKNDFGGNGPCPPFDRCDVFVAASRGVVLASNCTRDQTATSSTTVPATGQEAEGIWAVGSCTSSATPHLPPPLEASLSAPSGHVGDMLVFDASASRDPRGLPQSYRWLIQRAGQHFVPAMLPEELLLGSGMATAAVSFPSPGLWDVDVIVDDGDIAANAWRTIAVSPQGTGLGRAASAWAYRCTTASCTTSIADDRTAVGGATSVRVRTDEAFPFAVDTPATRDLALNASALSRLCVFLRADNANGFGWQGMFPTIVLGDSNGGRITYVPAANLLPTSSEEWIFVDLPLAGGEGWTRTDTGGATTGRVDFVEIETDTWGYLPYTLWIDTLTIY